MEAFERRDCQAVILRENSTVCFYRCDPVYDVAFTDPSILLTLYGVFLSLPERQNYFKYVETGPLKLDGSCNL